MRAIGDSLLVKVQSEVKEKIDGTEFFTGQIKGVDSFNESLSNQGVVVCSHVCGIPAGTKVYYHHFTVAEKNDLEPYKSNGVNIGDDEIVYLVDIKDGLYGLVGEDGKYHPMSGWVFVEPLYAPPQMEGGFFMDIEDIESAIMGMGQLMKNCGTIKYIDPEYANKLGATVGDEVEFVEGMDFKIPIENEQLYRVHISDILFKLKRDL